MGESKKQKSGDRQIIKKPSFASPFSITWPEVEKEVNKRIIDELKRDIQKYLSGRNVAKGGTEAATSDEKIKQPYREYLLLGINAVTKALEKGPLSLVLVCRSITPIDMSYHLIPLCAMQKTDACAISGLNNAICEALDLHSALVVGFKVKQDNPLSDLICYIKDKTPNFTVPWLEIWQNECNKFGESEQKNSKAKSTDRETLESKEASESNFDEPDNKPDKGAQKIAGKKRKFDHVKYCLLDTNFQMIEVPKPKKK